MVSCLFSTVCSLVQCKAYDSIRLPVMRVKILDDYGAAAAVPATTILKRQLFALSHL